MKNLLIKTKIMIDGKRFERRLQKDARDPQKTQSRVMRRILAQGRHTEYGVAHRFGSIGASKDPTAEFRKRVPVNDYEDLRPWIEKQDETGELSIVPKNPLRYAMTSGTTGKSKYIPILESTLKTQSALQRFMLYTILREVPDALDGSVLSIVSPGTEGYLPESGRPFGSTSGHMYEGMPRIIQSKYVVPAKIFSIEDYDLKYLVVLRLAIARRDVSFLTTANPSTIVRMANLLNKHFDRLAEELRTGTFGDLERLNHAQRKALLPHLGAMPLRAAELAALRERLGSARVRLQHVFPDLRVVACWTSGSCRVFLGQLTEEFAATTVIRDLGYLSSEFRGTSPLSSASDAGVPSLQSNYFEFVRREDWDAGLDKFVGLHELADGGQYYIFVTTDCGLYRYHMNDVVEVSGFYERTPLLRFVQKGKGVTNITGEKLYENQIISCVSQLENEYGLRSVFHMTVADEAGSVYRIYYEPAPDSEALVNEVNALAATCLDKMLGKMNVEYAAKRASGRIRPIELRVLRPGSYEAYKRECLAAGQREGQFKIVALQYAKDVRFNFGEYTNAAITLTA